MMRARPVQYRPSLALLRWLLDTGPDVPTQVRDTLVGELLTAPGAVVMGAAVGFMGNVAALFLHFQPIFVVFGLVDFAIGVTRLLVISAVSRARAEGRPGPMGLALLLAIAWCALQGLASCIAMLTGEPSLQILAAIVIMGLLGPVCARNYPAPRLAFLLVCLCDLPFVVGCCFSGQPWLLMTLPMTPPALFGALHIVRSYHKLAVTALTGQMANEHLARHDPLTGLRNRLGFGDAVEAVLGAGSGHAVVLCLDLDGFKSINDTFGHHVGDSVLVEVSRRIEACVRRGDLVFRLGGDEFVVLAENTPPDTAERLAARLIQDISREPYCFEGAPPVRIGVSVGFACAPDDATVAEDLHRRADNALYVSKAKGKGRLHRYDLRLAS